LYAVRPRQAETNKRTGGVPETDDLRRPDQPGRPLDELEPEACDSSRGFWQYTQHIKVYDDVDPTITVAAFDPFCSYDSPTAADPICEGPVTIDFSCQRIMYSGRRDDQGIPRCVPRRHVPLRLQCTFEPERYDERQHQRVPVSGSYPNYTITSRRTADRSAPF
jgi:hypothetical protein